MFLKIFQEIFSEFQDIFMNLTYAGTFKEEWDTKYILKNDKSQNIPINRILKIEKLQFVHIFILKYS